LLPGDKICDNRAPFELFTSLSGGVFSGPVAGSYLDPSKGLGNASVTYKYTKPSTGCSISTTVPFYILKSPQVSFIPSDVCIESLKDSTRFVNTTVSEDVVNSWSWSFAEVGAALDFRKEPAFLYKTGGVHSITLTASTLNSCTATKTSTIDLGVRPDGNFFWRNDCYAPNAKIKLFEDTKSDFPLASRNWKFGNGGQVSTDISPEFTMTDTGYVQVRYIVKINYKDCADTVIRNVYLTPTYALAADGSYAQNFEVGKAGWQKDDSVTLNNWTFKRPDRRIINSAFSGTNAWFTRYDTLTQVQEKSSVISPCFDFRGTERPMISIMMFKRFDRGRNGAALQYKLEGSNVWKIVGTVDDGINWYNSAVISGSPGGDKIGWTTTATADAKWTESLHKLDMLKGEKNVKFRITYGSDGYSSLNEGIAFDDVWIGERSRNVLLEHFTNNSSKAASVATASINDVVSKNDLDLINIQYHTNFPGTDPY
jgi:PKD repeat protein